MSIDFTEAFVAIGSENFDKAVGFYAAILGRQPDEQTRDIHVAFHLPGLRLALFKPRATHTALFRNPPDRRSGLSLVLRVPNVEQARAELIRLGAPEPSPVIETSLGREVYGYDPDGNRLILVHSTR
jgi:catechol 2,3-dioxygenase-like lactoylglutathione lyase family enzyme